MLSRRLMDACCRRPMAPASPQAVDTGTILPVAREYRLFFGGVPERSKGSDCKSDGSAFGGSNPPPSTRSRAIYPPAPKAGEDEDREEVRRRRESAGERRAKRGGPEGGTPQAWSNPPPSTRSGIPSIAERRGRMRTEKRFDGGAKSPGRTSREARRPGGRRPQAWSNPPPSTKAGLASPAERGRMRTERGSTESRRRRRRSREARRPGEGGMRRHGVMPPSSTAMMSASIPGCTFNVAGSDLTPGRSKLGPAGSGDGCPSTRYDAGVVQW